METKLSLKARVAFLKDCAVEYKKGVYERPRDKNRIDLLADGVVTLANELEKLHPELRVSSSHPPTETL